MSRRFPVSTPGVFQLTLAWALLASTSSAQQLIAPESVQPGPDGTFRYTVQFINGPQEDSLYGLGVFGGSNTNLGTTWIDWFCEFGTIAPGGGRSFEIPILGGQIARLIDPTREGRVTLSLTLCRSGTISATTRILPTEPRIGIDTGNTPNSVAIADLDGDGHPDLVTSNQDSGDVSVLLGHGDGSFESAVSYRVERAPQFVAVADLNGDTRLDLATASVSRNDVSVLLGNGDGTFQPPVGYSTGANSYSVAVADFDLDGAPDLVVAHVFTNSVSVLLGNGDGAFAPAGTYPAGVRPESAVAADLDGDAAPDVVVASPNEFGVRVLLGNGDGTLRAAVPHLVGGQAYRVAVADLDQDGALDVVTSTYSRDSVSVLLGYGNGNFRPHSLFPAGDGPSFVAVADLNGDEALDLAVPNSVGNDLSLLLGNGDGTFQPPVFFPTNFSPAAAAVADLDRNGVPDVAVANRLSDNIRLTLNPFEWTIPASIDIKPDSELNRVNRSALGSIPVALLGSDGFDVAVVDVSTLVFGGGAASPVHDLSDPDTLANHLGDVNQDGFVDLVTHYSIQEAAFSIGDTEACLSGKLLNERSFEGCDSVWVFGARGARRSTR